jgi:hypothetical protein
MFSVAFDTIDSEKELNTYAYDFISDEKTLYDFGCGYKDSSTDIISTAVFGYDETKELWSKCTYDIEASVDFIFYCVGSTKQLLKVTQGGVTPLRVSEQVNNLKVSHW